LVQGLSPIMRRIILKLSMKPREGKKKKRRKIFTKEVVQNKIGNEYIYFRFMESAQINEYL
jgi:hypothetical protein